MTKDKDREAISRVIRSLYTAISGPAGPRDWATHMDVFHREGRQIRTGVDADNSPWIKFMDPAAYRTDTQPFFERSSFYERELACRIDILGNIAHAWSLYEARTDLNDPEPERRGINSIQLFRSSEGVWEIVSMIWDNERPGVVAEPF